MGMKMIPTTKKVMITGLGVKIGCHARSRCCLNAVAEHFFTNEYVSVGECEGKKRERKKKKKKKKKRKQK
jgi:hypothetical protein